MSNLKLMGAKFKIHSNKCFVIISINKIFKCILTSLVLNKVTCHENIAAYISTCHIFIS